MGLQSVKSKLGKLYQVLQQRNPKVGKKRHGGEVLRLKEILKIYQQITIYGF